MPESGEDVLLELEARPESAQVVRRVLAVSCLRRDVAPRVALLATEVVGNAVRHAGLRDDQRILFVARLTPDRARIEVVDTGPGFGPDAVERTDGFGLRLVDKLAERWGVDHDEGCRVWFEVGGA